ncbi:Undecaprenyl diphosphate synthase, partial [hydrothermal vent metagenome]
GRWAQARNLPHALGHRKGAETVRLIAQACGHLGIEVLTLYAFSSENWKRPPDEIEALMQLCIAYCKSEREKLRNEGIRVKVIGRTGELPEAVQEALGELTEATSHVVGPTLCLAINYGSRAEITDAVRTIAARVQRGELDPDAIDEAVIDGALGTADLPDPDLLIRTAGEMRLSNFLLWQISYAELYVTETYWPDFGVEGFCEAIRAFAARDRRFGARPAGRSPSSLRRGC